MLSRIAESLYWLGRHTERADCTARILDTYLQLLNTGSWRSDRQVVGALVQSMGLSEDKSLHGAAPTALLRTLVFSTENASSVSGALAAARENARGVRDLLPQDIWECLNVTWHGLSHRSTKGPHAYLRWMSERCAMAAGLVSEVMRHDESWQFVVLGRSLERADLTIRLLTAAQPQPGTLPRWREMVSACGGWEPYVRAHGSGIGYRSATEFVLLDRHFPRSVLSSLATAEECLATLEPLGAPRDPAGARWIIGRARTGLDYRAGTDLSPDLALVLGELRRSVSAAHDAVSSGFFRRGDDITWATVGTEIEVF